MAKPCTPHLIAQRVQLFKLQTANVGGRGELPSPFSGGFKGGILFGKRIPPLLSVSAQCGNLPSATRALFLLEKEKSEPKPAEAESARQRVHLPVHRLFGLAERFVHGGDDEVLEHFHVLGAPGAKL